MRCGRLHHGRKGTACVRLYTRRITGQSRTTSASVGMIHSCWPGRIYLLTFAFTYNQAEGHHRTMAQSSSGGHAQRVLNAQRELNAGGESAQVLTAAMLKVLRVSPASIWAMDSFQAERSVSGGGTIFHSSGTPVTSAPSAHSEPAPTV